MRYTLSSLMTVAYPEYMPSHGLSNFTATPSRIGSGSLNSAPLSWSIRNRATNNSPRAPRLIVSSTQARSGKIKARTNRFTKRGYNGSSRFQRARNGHGAPAAQVFSDFKRLHKRFSVPGGIALRNRDSCETNLTTPLFGAIHRGFLSVLPGLSSPNNLLPFPARIAYSRPMPSLTNARGCAA